MLTADPPDVLPTESTAEVPTYFGRLYVARGRRGRPWLMLACRCRRCRGLHFHTWSPHEWSPTPRCPHCSREAHRRAGEYMVAPARTRANLRVMWEYVESLAEWEAARA